MARQSFFYNSWTVLVAAMLATTTLGIPPPPPPPSEIVAPTLASPATVTPTLATLAANPAIRRAVTEPSFNVSMGFILSVVSSTMERERNRALQRDTGLATPEDVMNVTATNPASALANSTAHAERDHDPAVWLIPYRGDGSMPPGKCQSWLRQRRDWSEDLLHRYRVEYNTDRDDMAAEDESNYWRYREAGVEFTLRVDACWARLNSNPQWWLFQDWKVWVYDFSEVWGPAGDLQRDCAMIDYRKRWRRMNGCTDEP